MAIHFWSSDFSINLKIECFHTFSNYVKKKSNRSVWPSGRQIYDLVQPPSHPVFGGSDGKESACYAGDSGSIPGSRRSPGEGNGNLLWYSCLENPTGQRILAGYSPWGRKQSNTTERLSTQHVQPPNMGLTQYTSLYWGSHQYELYYIDFLKSKFRNKGKLGMEVMLDTKVKIE